MYGEHVIGITDRLHNTEYRDLPRIINSTLKKKIATNVTDKTLLYMARLADYGKDPES